MRKFLAVGLIVAALVASACASPATAGELPRDFSQKYGLAVRKLQDYYTHALITGTMRREYPLEDRWQEQTYTYRADGMNYRLDFTTQSRRRGIPQPGTKEVYLALPTASFYGVGRPDAPQIATSSELSYTETKARIQKTFPFDQPFAFDTNGTIIELLRSPRVHVESLKNSTRDGKAMVTIFFDEDNNRSPNERSWVVLSPEEGWAVRRYSQTVGKGANQMTYRGTINYGEIRDGVPIVDRIESWQEKGPQRVCTLHETISISRFVEGNPAPVLFTADGF